MTDITTIVDGYIAAWNEPDPAGHRFELAAGPDAHPDRVRFAWRMVGADDGTPVAAGVDFSTVAGDGRLREVTGFLEAAG